MSNEKDFVIENGVLVKYKGKGDEVVVPDGVTKIDAEVFRKKSKITSVVVPEGVREIGDFAFQECTKLERVLLPQSLEMVRKGAFDYCRSLTELIFPRARSLRIPTSRSIIVSGCSMWNFPSPCTSHPCPDVKRICWIWKAAAVFLTWFAQA